jgi:23S rRNA (cytosine1962-C5)-methyltransferase
MKRLMMNSSGRKYNGVNPTGKKSDTVKITASVFGEGDFLPALVIDKFFRLLRHSNISIGMDRWKESIIKVLNELIHPKGIYERNDVPVRKLEGLTEQKKFLSSPFSTRFQIEESE